MAKTARNLMVNNKISDMQVTNSRNQRSDRGGSPRHYPAAPNSDRTNSLNKNVRSTHGIPNERARYNAREIYRLNDLYERGSI